MTQRTERVELLGQYLGQATERYGISSPDESFQWADYAPSARIRKLWKLPRKRVDDSYYLFVSVLTDEIQVIRWNDEDAMSEKYSETENGEIIYQTTFRGYLLSLGDPCRAETR